SWLHAHSLAVFLLLTAVATVRIVATYGVFNHTIDEPTHVICGLEWLERGTYQLEAQHPPLARVFTALGPYLAGCRLPAKSPGPAGIPPTAQLVYKGADLLYERGQYLRNLVLARLGVVPFFWLAAMAVYVWGRRYLGEMEALLAVFLFT